MRGIPVARPWRFVISLFVLTVVIDAWVSWSLVTRWYGWGPSVANQYQNLGRFGDVLCGISGAYLAVRLRPIALGSWGATAVRSRAAIVFAAVAACVVPVHAAHLAIVVAMSIVSRAASIDGGLPWWTVLIVPAAVASSLFWTLVGIVLGLRLPAPFALATAAILPFVAVILLDVYAYESPLAVFTLSNSGSFASVRPTDATLILRAAAWMGIALLLMMSVLRVAPRFRRSLPYLTGSIAALALLNGYAFQSIPGARDVVCRGADPQICLTRPYGGAYSSYRAMVSEAWPSVPTQLRRPRITSPEAADTSRTAGIVSGPSSMRDSVTMLPERAPTLGMLGEALWPDASCAPAWAQDTRAAFEVWWLRTLAIADTGSSYPGQPDYAAMDSWKTVSSQVNAIDVMDGVPSSSLAAVLDRLVRECAPAFP